jgi:hypothetical protein
MSTRAVRRVVAGALVSLGLAGGLGACGSGSPKLVVHSIQPLTLKTLPPQVLGLAVRSEAADQLKQAKRPYIDAVAFYSLRKGDELQATLQVSRFDQSARLSDPKFVTSLVSQIGSTAPKAVRMGHSTVYLTTGTRQSVSVWLRGRDMFILSSREDYTQPRGLLRALLAVES